MTSPCMAFLRHQRVSGHAAVHAHFAEHQQLVLDLVYDWGTEAFGFDS